MRRKQGKPYKFGNGGEVPGYADGGMLGKFVGKLREQDAAQGGGGGPPQGMPAGGPRRSVPEAPSGQDGLAALVASAAPPEASIAARRRRGPPAPVRAGVPAQRMYAKGGDVPGVLRDPVVRQAVAQEVAKAVTGAPARPAPPQGMPPQGPPQGMPPQGPPQGMPPRQPPAQAALAAGARPVPGMAKGGRIDGVATRGKTKCRSV